MPFRIVGFFWDSTCNSVLKRAIQQCGDIVSIQSRRFGPTFRQPFCYFSQSCSGLVILVTAKVRKSDRAVRDRADVYSLSRFSRAGPTLEFRRFSIPILRDLNFTLSEAHSAGLFGGFLCPPPRRGYLFA